MERKIDAKEAVEALKTLEAELGRTPSVAEIAEELKVSTSTALRYLDYAVEEGLIVKRDGKFLTHVVADAYRRD